MYNISDVLVIYDERVASIEKYLVGVDCFKSAYQFLLHNLFPNLKLSIPKVFNAKRLKKFKR